MGAGSRLQALVVDDDPDVRFVLRAILESEGYAVETVADAAAADASVAASPPDVAVIDLRLPAGREGLGLARRVHDRFGAGVVVLSAEDAVEEKLAAFASGADDYVTKPFDARELVARIGAVSRRRRAGTHRILRAGDVAVDEDARVVTRAGHPIPLTKLEFDVLAALIRRRGVVCSRSQLLGEVWGFDGLAGNVVEVHVSSLRRKLEAHGPRLVHTVRGVGYVVRG